MRKLKEIARLRYEAGRSYSEIAAAAGVARSTVQVRLARLSKAGLRWPWPDEIDETTLEADRYERPGQSEAWRATSCSSTTRGARPRIQPVVGTAGAELDESHSASCRCTIEHSATLRGSPNLPRFRGR